MIKLVARVGAGVSSRQAVLSAAAPLTVWRDSSLSWEL